MPRLRLALAQIDPTVGDLVGNSALVTEWTRKAAGAGARLVAFPEMMLTGYPVEDLVFRESFVRASQRAVAELAHSLAGEGLGDTVVAVGYLDADAGGQRNALAVIHQGRIVARYFKHHLPNYGVFDEDRYFTPGDTLVVVRIGGIDVAMTICEDLWQAGGPFAVAASARVGLVVNINGSPYELNKDDVRLDLVARRSAEARATIAYVNMVGAQDELVFDGDSMIVRPDGSLIARAPQFAEHLMVVDLDLPAAVPDAPTGDLGEMAVERHVISAGAFPESDLIPGEIAPRVTDEAEIWQALVLGLRDYVRKNGFRGVGVALSGGIDSSIVAAIACDAIGPSRVTGVSLPSGYSSQHSQDDAADLARRTGLNYRVVPIQPMVDGFLANLALDGLAVENLQARVRAVIMMAISNQEGPLILTTGNKSELAVGYSTIYGDAAGGFNPIKDVPKTMVWRLSTWRNEEAVRRGELPPIPENSITKPPSAELRPGQLDSDSLPDYELLDALLLGYIDGDMGRDDLVAAGHDPALVDRVLRMVDLAEYKRRQAAPGTKISIKAFGRDRRLPITNRFREGAI